MLAMFAAVTGLAAPLASATPAHAADTARVTLPCDPSSADATGPKAKDFCWIDWSSLPLHDGTTPVRIQVEGGRIDANVTLSHTTNATMFVRDYSKPGIDNIKSYLQTAYGLTGGSYAIGFRQAVDNQWGDRDMILDMTGITPVPDVSASRLNTLQDFRMAFGDAEVMSGVSDGSSYEQTVISSDKTLDKLGWIGDTDPASSYWVKNTGYGTDTVTLAGGTSQPGNTGSKGRVVVGATEPSRFKVDFSQKNLPNGSSAIAVGVYMPYRSSYPLTYDANGGTFTQTPNNQ